MKLMQAFLKLTLVSPLVLATVVTAGLTALAQTATTTTTTPTASTALKAPKPTTSTDLMVQEACQRQKARTAKFQQFGIKEQWGSEEPFIFDPKAPRC
jgi:curli biogenesis system outer membrane secretion channel CsgG